MTIFKFYEKSIHGITDFVHEVMAKWVSNLTKVIFMWEKFCFEVFGLKRTQNVPKSSFIWELSKVNGWNFFFFYVKLQYHKDFEGKNLFSWEKRFWDKWDWSISAWNFSFLTWSYSSIKAENWVKHVLANFCFGICRDSCFLKKSCFAFFAETILINCELKIHLFLFKCTKLFIKITTSIIKIDFGAIFLESIVLQSIYFLKERWVFNIWLIELEAFQLSPSCTQCHVVLIKLRMLRENIYFIWLFLLIIWESFIETEYKECNLGKF